VSINKLLRVSAGMAAAVLGVGLMAWPAPAAKAAAAYGNGFIAYGTGGTSWNVVDPSGSNQASITPSGPSYPPGLSVNSVSYSPDARQVAFSASGLWVASADGSGAHRVADIRFRDLIWMPDGTDLVFSDGTTMMSVPADGSRPPTPLFAPVSLCWDYHPHVTTRGAIFFTRFCKPEGQPTSLAVYHLGDPAPSILSTERGAIFGDAGVVSPNGTRILRTLPGKLVVQEIGSNGDSGDTVATFPEGDSVFARFGSSGDIAYLDLRRDGSPQNYTYRLYTVADSPLAVARIVIEGSSSTGIFLDWVNGSSRLPLRPVAERVGGTDRIDTAVKASRWAFDAIGASGRRAAVAVLARSDLYPDALTGTALAIQMGGPLLLTPSGSLAPAVGAELHRILAPGSTVYLAGGTTALNPAVADAVRRLGFTPIRLAGADRYGTAVAIATAISGHHPKSILLATGSDFPDALTAAVAAGQERYTTRGTDAPAGGVVLLTEDPNLPTATSAYLNTLTPSASATYVVGGPAATALDRSLPGWPNVTRLVGVDRFDTAARVATSALFSNGASGRYTTTAVATGLNFPDAMSGGALIGSLGGPLLLADANGLTTQEKTILYGNHLSDVVVVGGNAAVSDRTLDNAADTAFGPHAWVTATNRVAPPLL
jgi:hypothetical protein